MVKNNMPKITPTMKTLLQGLYTGTALFQEDNLRAMQDLSPYGEKVSLIGYDHLPETVFEDAAALRADPEARSKTYDTLSDTATVLALVMVDNAIFAEIEYLTFHTLHNNEMEIARSRARLTDIVKHVDAFQKDNESQAGWIEQKRSEYEPRLAEKHADYIRRNLTASQIESHLYEQAVLAYMQASEAFVKNSDVHMAMIVMHLSDDPKAVGGLQHRKFFQAIIDELEASRNLMETAARLYPGIRHTPDFEALSRRTPKNRMN